MEKEYVARHPRIKEEQVSFTDSLVSMLNCRRYLESQSFGEEFEEESWYGDINCISGQLLFPDGSEVSNSAFCETTNTSSRDALLERMISKNALFKRLGFNLNYERSQVIKTTFSGRSYGFELSVRDTTREKSFFPVKIFLISPRKFAFSYRINLSKDVITDANLQEFEKYRLGLEDATKQDSLLTYSPQVPQRKSAQAQEVEMPQVETPFINPWEVKIPKLGGKKNE